MTHKCQSGSSQVLAALVAVIALSTAHPVWAAEAAVPTDQSTANGEWVVLLHGLARTGKSMKKMSSALRAEGFNVCIVDYPSTQHTVEIISHEHVAPAIQDCVPANQTVHVVSHSLGGIIVRYMARENLLPGLGRVVMLSPPNKGSEIVNTIGDWRLYKAINGPAGDQLGVEPDSLPNTLGPPDFELGVITGKRSINWILSTMIEGKDDGKVSVESARLDGMADFRVIAATHPFIMRNRHAIRHTIAFLHDGRFSDPH